MRNERIMLFNEEDREVGVVPEDVQSWGMEPESPLVPWGFEQKIW